MKVKEPIIGILGFIYDKTFYNITINEFTKNDEERMIKNFIIFYKISKNKM